MWLMNDESAPHADAISFEIQKENKVITKSSFSKTVKKKKTFESTRSPQIQNPQYAIENQETIPAHQTIELQSSTSHPYFKDVWQILKKKKQSITTYSKNKENYFVKFLLKKNGIIEEVEVHGSEIEVVNEIVFALSEIAELPPIPDEVSNLDLQINYQVEI